MECLLNQYGFHLENEFYEADDNTYHEDSNDFYSSLEDNRVWTSNVEDINGGDNFADFCENYFKLLEEEDYFED
ncbi:MAG: hypothetical protein J6R59_10745 [Paludibacteraceae bacterium]|nr:hypothetical protein [Paludibacteraceae bacterium]